MDHDNRTRDRRYKDRQRERGFVQILLWVPADKARDLTQLAKKLRKEASPPSGNTGGISPPQQPLFPEENQ